MYKVAHEETHNETSVKLIPNVPDAPRIEVLQLIQLKVGFLNNVLVTFTILAHFDGSSKFIVLIELALKLINCHGLNYLINFIKLIYFISLWTTPRGYDGLLFLLKHLKIFLINLIFYWLRIKLLRKTLTKSWINGMNLTKMILFVS